MWSSPDSAENGKLAGDFKNWEQGEDDDFTRFILCWDNLLQEFRKFIVNIDCHVTASPEQPKINAQPSDLACCPQPEAKSADGFWSQSRLPPGSPRRSPKLTATTSSAPNRGFRRVRPGGAYN
jgi:hypothetical protein